jgi:cobaltochelatase CobT
MKASAVDSLKPLPRVFFDAVKRRVEAIGYAGCRVAANLDAMLDDRFHRARYADIAVRAAPPMTRSR